MTRCEHGNLVGITYKQMESGEYEPDVFEYDEYGMVLKGGGSFFGESVGFIYTARERKR